MEREKKRNGIESMTMTSTMTLAIPAKVRSILDLSWVVQGYIHIHVELEQVDNIVQQVLYLFASQF